MKKNRQIIDDHTTIVNMNVEGMPGYIPPNRAKVETYFTKSEMRSIMFGALKAGLLISAVFSLGLILFVLFCLKLWFKL